MTCVDEREEEIDVVTDVGPVGSGVVAIDGDGAWCWYEVLERGEHVVLRQRRDWGDPEW